MPSVKSAVSAAIDAIGGVSRIGEDPDSLILFNAAFSVCSEKCRTVIRETGFSHTNVNVDLTTMINYDPRYVALRLMAWDHAMPLAGEIAGWTGSSSMAKTGFDPCVVPLLVDMKANGGEGMVIVDSAVICNYLVRLAGGALMPTEPRQLALVQKHIALVDDAPHPALLYDALPAKDLRPAYLKHLTAGGGLHLQQIRKLKKYLAQEGKTWDDPLLKRAYEAKLKKTEDALRATQSMEGGDSSYIEGSFQKMREYLQTLEADLKASSGEWLCGDKITLADVFEACSLYRLMFLGCAFLYEDLPIVVRYSGRLFSRPSLLRAVILNRDTMPSKHVAPFYAEHEGWLSGVLHCRKEDLINVMTNPATPYAAAGAALLAVTYPLARSKRR